MIQTDVIKHIAAKLKENGFTDTDTQVLMLAEETGEFVGAYRRYTNRARRKGTLEAVHEELADIIIGALCVAEFMEVDINAVIQDKLVRILNRGWRNE